jgi:hypothetical protein
MVFSANVFCFISNNQQLSVKKRFTLLLQQTFKYGYIKQYFNNTYFGYKILNIVVTNNVIIFKFQFFTRVGKLIS